MNLYILKYNMIYYICNCPKNIIIPINDIQAVNHYKNNKLIKLYNKKYIADTQNFINGDNTIIPNQFPIIVRPKINLMGMGKDAYFINNLSKFKENNIVSIKFTSNDQEYDFKARDQEAYDYVTQGVEKTYAKKESMGKFLNAMRSSDRLVEIDN